ncbi:MAG TPA: NAD(+)/NADH kinase [Thermoplasmata archaeon]|nr:NAD(+)/NADH kinase [Thermoplasmata archaeon]
MKIALSANPTKPLALDLVRTAIDRLGKGAELVLSSETHAALGPTAPDLPHAPLETLRADVLVAIGGDGTFLWSLQRSSLPLLPINAGTLGFLAEVDGTAAGAFEGALSRLLEGRYLLDPRMRLASQWNGQNLPDATNEIVVHTSQVAKMRIFELSVDHRPVGRIRADGVLISTPTGSTSYSLSALGPIVEPTLEAIVVTALAPFQTPQRSLLIDPLRTIGIRLVHPDKDGVVVVDGQNETKLPGGSAVLAYRSPRPAFFVRFGSRFFRQLQGKRILPWSEEVDAAEDADLSPAP